MPPSYQTPPHLTTLRRDRARRRELSAALRQRQRHATGTWLLVAVNVAIYIAMVIDAGRIATFPTRPLIAWGALFAPRVADGEWWRLFTATFLHVHVLHIAFNMIALCMVGPVVERLVGIRTFLIFYVASGLAGTALSLWFHPLTTAAGASGSIIGLYGVLLAMMFERHPATPLTLDEQAPFVSRLLLHGHLQDAVGIIASTLIFGWFDPHADNAGHIGGFLGGCLFGWIAGRDIEWRLPAPRASAAAVAAALGCCAVSLTVQRNFIDVRPALIEVFAVDSRATAQYSQLVKSRADNDIVTRAIQEEILPAFSRERRKLDAAGSVPREQTAILADLRRYLLLRESYWRQRAAAAGRTDETTWRQLDEADHATDAVMRRLLAAR
jgi:membrane associated rhomboid family serine protease